MLLGLYLLNNVGLNYILYLFVVPSTRADRSEWTVGQTVVRWDGVVDKFIFGDRSTISLDSDEASFAWSSVSSSSDLERRGVALLKRQAELTHVRQSFPACLDRTRSTHSVTFARWRQTAAYQLHNKISQISLTLIITFNDLITFI